MLMARIFKEIVDRDECIVTDSSIPLVEVYFATFMASQNITRVTILLVSWELLGD